MQRRRSIMRQKGARLNIKPEFLTTFHGDLIDSLLQGLDKTSGRKKSSSCKKSSRPPGVHTKCKAVQTMPPLDLSKVNGRSSKYSTVREDLLAKRDKILKCTGVQLHSGELERLEKARKNPKTIRRAQSAPRVLAFKDSQEIIASDAPAATVTKEEIPGRPPLPGLDRIKAGVPESLEHVTPRSIASESRLESHSYAQAPRSIASESGLESHTYPQAPGSVASESRLDRMTLEMDFQSAHASLSGRLVYTNKLERDAEEGGENPIENDAKTLSLELANSLEKVLSKLTKGEGACETRVSIYMGDQQPPPPPSSEPTSEQHMVVENANEAPSRSAVPKWRLKEEKKPDKPAKSRVQRVYETDYFRWNKRSRHRKAVLQHPAFRTPRIPKTPISSRSV